MRYKMDQMSAQLSKELSGWKEIASHLGVGVRTAQDYERNLGLPVHRQPGDRGRVFAHPDELDVWRKPANGSGAPARSEDAVAEAQPPAPVRKTWPRRLLMPAVLAVPLLALAAYLLLIPHGPPSDFRVEGKNLIVFNDKGQELWRHAFEVPLNESAYSQEGKLRLGWLGDLDGDGRRQFVFVVSPLNRADVGTQVLCFAADGKIRWHFTPGRAVTNRSGLRFVPPYFMGGLHVLTGKAPADTRIAVSSHHYLEYPNQVAFLDIQGRVVGEYWHPGHLSHSSTADLDRDGRKVLVLAGVNNANHQATLVVLDPLKVVGLTTPKEMLDHRLELIGMPPARERAVVFFPRSCISHGQPYTRASVLNITRERLVVHVAEGTAEESAGFVYELDYGLNVISVTPDGVGVMQLHHALEARGLLDHPYSPEECERLKASVVVRRDGQDTAARLR